MPAALLGATRCRRCGGEVVPEQSCGRCGAAWIPAVPGIAGREAQTPLTGVVRASVGRRCVAHAIDLVAPVALVVLGVLMAAGVVRAPVPWWVPTAVAVVILLTQLAVMTVRGRTLGRRLLRLRSVDDLTGTPIRPSRLLATFTTTGPRHRLVTADLRRGRDPWRLQLVAPASPPPSHDAHDQPVAAPTTPSASAPAAPPTTPRPSVGIVLDTGERYEITGALLVGRSPVDTAGSDRAVLAWPDLTRRLAKTHALLEWSGTILWVTDLDSATGTSVVAPGGGRELLVPGVRTAAALGATITCGGRSMKVVPGA